MVKVYECHPLGASPYCSGNMLAGHRVQVLQIPRYIMEYTLGEAKCVDAVWLITG